MKRLFLTLLAVVIVSSLIFSGCAGTAPAPAPAPGPAPAPSPAPAPAKTIKIGVLYPLTGFMAQVGQEHLEGFKLAFERANYEVAGKKIELIVDDTAYAPAVAIDKARKMVEYDKVFMIAGTIGAHVNIAVGEYMSKLGLPLLIAKPAPWPNIMQPWVILGAGTEHSYSSAMGDYAYEKLGYRTVSILTVDAAHGHGFADSFKSAFEAKGGKVIQEQFTPDPPNDLAPHLVTLKDADALGAWFSGAGAILFYTQMQEFSIRKKMPHIAIFFGAHFDTTTFRNVPPAAGEALIGDYAAAPYTPLLEHQENKEFVEIWKQRHGFLPADNPTTAYDAALQILAALKVTGGDTTPEKLREAFLNLDMMGTHGRIVYDRETRARIRDVYIVRAAKKEGDFVWEPVYTYKDVPPIGFAPPPPPPGAGRP